MAARYCTVAAVAALVLGFATGAAAQSGPPHRGVVRDHSGNPVPGVVVTLQHPEETAIRVVLTDLRGRYEVSALERGVRYDVQMSHPAFRKARVKASAGDRVSVNLKPRSCRRAAQQASADFLR